MKKSTCYYLLDKNDITCICGIMEKKEILKKMKMNEIQFKAWLSNDELFEDKYYLVETEGDELLSDFGEYKIIDTNRRSKWIMTEDAKIYKIGENGVTEVKYHPLKKRKNKPMVQINGKQYIKDRLFYKLFIGDIPDYKSVCYKDNNLYNITKENLYLKVKRR